MLHRLFKLYLKFTGKKNLLPFLDSIAVAGKPSSVYFPEELIEQGLGILLSGLNNTLLIQSNLDWVWPYWVERQQDPSAQEFIPTGVNVITANLSHRNWSSIGVPGSQRESMVDPVGMLTLEPYGWSIFPYLRYQGKNYFPSKMEGKVNQKLKNGIDPCILTQYHAHPDILWSSETMAMKVEGEELIYFSHELQNKSREPIQLVFGMAIRPFNPLTLGHINRLKFKKSLWRVNRRPALLLYNTPDRTNISDRHQGDPLFLKHSHALAKPKRSLSGMLAGGSEFDLKLEPGETKKILTLGTVAKSPRRPEKKFRHIYPKLIEERKEEIFNLWKKEKKKGMEIEIPDKEWQRVFRAIKSKLHVFDDVSHFTPGTYIYHQHWIRDSAFIALTFDHLSFHQDVKPKMLNFLKLQQQDGFFKSQNGEWDSNGQVLFTLINHARHSGDFDLLKQTFPQLCKGAKWIEKMIAQNRAAQTPHRGLLPAGFSAEHFGPNNHYFWDNFWALAGLESLIWAAKKLSKNKSLLWLETVYEEYKNDVEAAIAQTMDRVGEPLLPASPYRNMDSAAIGNLVALSPLRLFSTEQPWVKPTTQFLLKHNVHNDLLFQSIIHTGLNPYLSVQLAKTLLALGDNRYMPILESLIAYGGKVCTWPEAINPLSRGGCMGDGDHGWAACEVLSLIRDCLIREESGSIILGSGIPGSWFKQQKPIRLKKASTIHGLVHYSFTPSKDGYAFSWEIIKNSLQDDCLLFLELPKGFFQKTKLKTLHRKNKIRIVLETLKGQTELFLKKEAQSFNQT